MSVETLGWALIHSLWQGALIAAIVTPVLALTRQSASAIRYTVCLVGLALMVAAPFTTALLVAPSSREAGSSVAANERAALATLPGGVRDARSDVVRGPGSPGIAGSHSSPSPVRAGLFGVVRSVRARLEPSMPLLVGVWLIGVALLSLRLVGGLRVARRLTTTGTTRVAPHIAELVRRLAERLGVARAIRVLQSANGQVPLVVGWLRPVIVIPLATLNGLTPQQLELILAHEIAHIRRYDFLVNVVQTVVETLLFFHPAVWWISGRIREEREHCCDDLAMSTLGADGRTYARALLAIEEWRGAGIGLAAAASGGSLLRRVRRIVTGDTPAPLVGARWIAGVLGVATVALAARSVVGAPAAFAVPFKAAVAPALTMGPKQSSGGRDGRDSTRARPSSVVRYEGSGALDQRWRWAERQARAASGDSVWIGYVVRGDAAGRRWYHFDRRVPVRIGRDSWSTGSVVFDGGSDLKDVSFSGTSLTPLVGDYAPYDVAIFIGVAPDRNGARVVRLHLGNVAFPVYFDRWPLVWLGEADDAESVALVERLRQTAPRQLAADLVAAVGVHQSTSVVVPALVAALDDRNESEDARTEAAEWLGQHPDRRALAALARSSRSEAVPHKVRESAIEATAHFALAAAADTVVALARSLSDRQLRQTAIESMGHRDEPRVFDALVSIVHDARNSEDQRNAVETLGNSLDKRRVDVLTGLARRDPEPSVRKQAVETLAQNVEGTDMVRTLVSIALNDADASVQETAVEQLADIEDPRAVDALVDIAQRRGNVELAKKAAEALGNSHEHAKAMAALSDLAWRSAEPDVQRTAVEALGEFEDARAVQLLADIANRHPSLDVQEAAAETVGQGHPHDAAMAALNDIVWKHKSERVQRAAVDGLGQFDEKRSTDLLLEIARRHPNAGVRKAALEALSN